MTIYNHDCIEGAKQHLLDESIDLMICDPPFGINESTFDKHYHRDENHVIEGYQEAPKDYYTFSKEWIAQAKRVLKPTGSFYFVSGWTNLKDVLCAINNNDLYVINHLIWKFNFGCNTSTKFVSSHYHIIYGKKKKSDKVTFNTNCRFGFTEKNESGGSSLYNDLEDVWVINKEYQPGEIKNKNKLPDELIRKMILYSSNQGDTICDFFLGNFTTANVAKRLGREITGFESNTNSYEYFIDKLNDIEFGCDLKTLKVVEDDKPKNQGKSLNKEEVDAIMADWYDLIKIKTKKMSIEELCTKYQRGHWSIQKLIKKLTIS